MALVIRRRGSAAREDNWEEQVFAGIGGALITTIPIFIVMPAWVLFSRFYAVEDANGRLDEAHCFWFNFLAGATCWLVFIFFQQAS